MKKIFSSFFLLVALFLVGKNATSQDSWVEIPYPAGITGMFPVFCNDGNIIGLVQNSKQFKYTSDLLTWGSSNSPVACVNSYVIFKGEIFIAGAEGIFKSQNGSSWISVCNFLNCGVLYSDQEYLYASGPDSITCGGTINLKSIDGTNWIPFYVSGYPSMGYAISDTLFVVEAFDPANESLLLKSFDHGDTWITVGTIPVYPTLPWSFSVENGLNIAGIVRFDTIETNARSFGIYNLTGPRGAYTGVTNFSGHTYISAGYNNNYYPYQGAVIIDGDTINQILWNDYVWGVFHNETNVFAYTSGKLFMLVDPLGAEEQKQKNEKVKLFPNPTNGITHVDVLEKTQGRIWNQIGSELSKISLEKGSNTIDLSSFPAGIYFLKISEGTYKIIKR